MTPAERAWTETHSALWGAKAAELRRRPDPHSYNRARGLQMVVDPMLARLAQAAPVAAPAVTAETVRKLAELQQCLASLTPYRDREGRMMRLDAIHVRAAWKVSCKIAALRGEAMPPEPPQLGSKRLAMLAAAREVSVEPIAPSKPTPPPEPVPFTIGPQLDLLL